MSTLNEDFLTEISKLEAVTFLGLARYFKIDLLDAEENPKTFSMLLEEVLKRFCALNRTQKRQIMRLVKNANRTEN